MKKTLKINFNTVIWGLLIGLVAIYIDLTFFNFYYQ